MIETMDQICVGVRVLLRRVSDLKLPPEDIEKGVNDNLRGKLQDMKLEGRERNTRVVEAMVTDDGIDFKLGFSGSATAEVEKLEFGGRLDSQTNGWQEARLVDLAAYGRSFDGGGVVASLYGKSKLKLNLTCQEACSYCWRVTYRESLLNVIQEGAALPLPSDFIPMIEVEVAVALMPQVQDDTAEWTAWMSRALDIYGPRIREWNNPDDKRYPPGRWQKYLVNSVEPQIQDIRPFNQNRRNVSGRVNTRAFWPRG